MKKEYKIRELEANEASLYPTSREFAEITKKGFISEEYSGKRHESFKIKGLESKT